MAAERVLVPLAEGFEEVEALAIVDVLRRAEVEVVTVSLAGRRVLGAHGIAVEADHTWDELDLESFTAIALPGGMPGTDHLRRDERVLALVRRLHGASRTTAAICAAPLVLAAAGVLEGHEITSHPGVREALAEYDPQDEPRVVSSGQVITSQGPGTALEFALALVERFRGEDVALRLAAAMRVSTPLDETGKAAPR